MSVAERRAMIEPNHARLSIAAQCRLVAIGRSSFYYRPVPESAETLALMRAIDAAFLDCPWYGSRQMARHLGREGWKVDGQDVGRRRVRRLMRLMGLAPIYQRPRTSDPHPGHRIYPYLLRDQTIIEPDHVWCAEPKVRGTRHHLPANAAWLPVPGGDHGLGEPQGAGVAALEYAGGGLLRRGA